MVFDVIFFTQHYCLYPKKQDGLLSHDGNAEEDEAEY